ncbi:uncharacterized protein LOC142351654 [Convolutriloba macropyga]|uniref:uncharacterized protein LOC142351654 n=1 Tax=Convolutriloba macropyga TaxID=536237 RepID=UPI003F526473
MVAPDPKSKTTSSNPTEKKKKKKNATQPSLTLISKIVGLVNLVLILSVIGVLGVNQFFIFSMWTDTTTDDLTDKIDDLYGRVQELNDSLDLLSMQHAGDFEQLTVASDQLNSRWSDLQTDHDKLSDDVNSLRVDFENGRQELWDSISELEDRIQVVNQSVLTGYAEAFSLVSSNFSNLTLGSGNESDPLQIRQIWAGIAQNEIRLKDLQKETEMMESIMADVGVGVDPEKLHLTGWKDSYSSFLDGDDNSCFLNSASGYNGKLYINITQGPAKIEYIDILLPTFPGYCLLIFKLMCVKTRDI